MASTTAAVLASARRVLWRTHTLLNGAEMTEQAIFIVIVTIFTCEHGGIHVSWQTDTPALAR